MSVIVEFTVADEEFLLGEVLAEPPEMYIELERLVPTGSTVIPYLWVQGADYRAFEEKVVESEVVASFEALDRLEGWVLYRIEWTDAHPSLLKGIDATGGVILEAYGNGGWLFRLRFPDHDRVSQFYNFCTEQSIAIHIERSFTLTERTEIGHQFGLSQEQREALLLGLKHGYFDTPSRASLSELTGELGISEQALSNRIRRGNKRVLERALLSRTTDRD